MKRNPVKKMFVLVTVLVMCLGLYLPASAGTSMGSGRSSYSSDLYSQLYSLPPFKFSIHKNGIGNYGTCPVYTAPSYSSFRCANGQAACSTYTKMDEAGFVSGWLLVRYETNNGSVRVGYIPPEYVRGFSSGMYPHFGYIPARAGSTIYVTDDPMRHANNFAWLDPGEQFHILSKYDYYSKDGLQWWYIECYVDGQLANGFIEMNSNFTPGY